MQSNKKNNPSSKSKRQENYMKQGDTNDRKHEPLWKPEVQVL